VCATAYQYDWKTMRRGNRVDEPVAEPTTIRRRSGQTQPMLRARRLRSNLPVRYRGEGYAIAAAA
jgi:hypothetical protein